MDGLENQKIPTHDYVWLEGINYFKNFSGTAEMTRRKSHRIDSEVDMDHHPPNQERAINLSILLVSGPGEISRVESN